MGKKAERIYPYIFSFLLVIMLIGIYFNFIDKNRLISDYAKIIEAGITFVTIIIGFLGAIIPVLLSMKNESNIVKYIFQNDTEYLFKKYLLNTITVGLIVVVISMILLLGDIYYLRIIFKGIVIFWIYFFLLFIFSTFRSLKRMIEIIFINSEKFSKEKKYNSLQNNKYEDKEYDDI